MEYRRLGASGLPVSVLSYGAWVTFDTQMAVEQAKSCMVAAYDAGVNFFDNAEVYAHGQAETIMGHALQELGWDRDSYIVSSKAMFGRKVNPAPTQMGLHRKHLVDGCHQALKRLQLDYIDLYFCHRPDPNTPIDEVVRTMNTLIQQGKILYWGTSEWSAQQIMEAFMVAREHHLIPPTMEQPQYNMLHRYRFEVEYARLFREFQYGTTIWSPLASGILTGKYNNLIPSDSRMNLPGYEWLKARLEAPEGQENLERARRLATISADLGVPMAKLALAWCLKNRNVSTVITGASRVEQVHENMKALAIVPQLTDDVMTEIEKALGNKPEPMELQL